MPSKSPAQARLMAAAAHTKGGYGGVPQSVGREFNQADKGTSIRRRKPAGYARNRFMGKISSQANERMEGRARLASGQSARDRAERGES